MERTLELTFAETDQDVELVEAARKGDRTAFDSLFERHRRYIYNICFRMLGSEEDAGDALQNSFIRAYRSLGRFKGRSSFRTWVYRIAVNVSVEALKTRKKAGTLPLSENTAVRPGSPQELVHEAVLRLPPDLRAPLVLFYVEGLSGEELAAALGCSAGAARVRLHRARQALKRNYEELEDELQECGEGTAGTGRGRAE